MKGCQSWACWQRFRWQCCRCSRADDVMPSRVRLRSCRVDGGQVKPSAPRRRGDQLAAIHHSASQLLVLADAQIEARDKEVPETVAVAQPH